MQKAMQPVAEQLGEQARRYERDRDTKNPRKVSWVEHGALLSMTQGDGIELAERSLGQRNLRKEKNDRQATRGVRGGVTCDDAEWPSFQGQATVGLRARKYWK
jgi:hypothetical protein